MGFAAATVFAFWLAGFGVVVAFAFWAAGFAATVVFVLGDAGFAAAVAFVLGDAGFAAAVAFALGDAGFDAVVAFAFWLVGFGVVVTFAFWPVGLRSAAALAVGGDGCSFPAFRSAGMVDFGGVRVPRLLVVVSLAVITPPRKSRENSSRGVCGRLMMPPTCCLWPKSHFPNLPGAEAVETRPNL
ncbi:hypothetical protein [Streptosporangium sp. 'caverna']|uniref:hypothetical protein n=1 Tax=Streptosporangium sp. 'caverna' TaxID=2202249 RepID=UPI000D7E8858|nr:hypothetical protein [Streptosporangium sp. 'caverna']AWS46207.1 hypothetical protein DKM19_37855 [Streptosporangium sp. 'caverna']